jgi:hypothetical protein
VKRDWLQNTPSNHCLATVERFFKKCVKDIPMKYLIAITCLFVSIHTILAQSVTTNNLASSHVYDSPAAVVPQALSLYEHMSGLTLIQDSRVSSVHKVIHIHGDVSSSTAPEQFREIAKIIEKDLREQSGIIITPLDGKRASVTYNDALSIAEQKQ